MDARRKVSATFIIVLLMFSAMASYTILTAKTPTPKIRVACVGDSITQGSGYPSKLQELLGINYTVGNFGVSGSTVSLNSSLPYMKQAAFLNAENFNPDIVLIMLGTNDANSEIAYNEDNFEADYTQLVLSFEGLASTPQVWVLKSPPIFSVDSNYSNTYLTSTIFPQIDELTTQMNLPTMNMYSVLENHSEYFFDGVHPNTDGANLIASNIYNSITSPDYLASDGFYW